MSNILISFFGFGSWPWFLCLFVCFVALRPKLTAMVIAGRSVHLTTLFSWASLNKQLTSNRAHAFAWNWQQPFMNDSFSGREENDRRNYFMINLHESMGPGRDRTRDPWICSQLRICNQTRYRLRYAARYLWRAPKVTLLILTPPPQGSAVAQW